MPTFRKIWNCEWTANAGESTKAHGKGTLTIYYSNGTNQEFTNVDRADFFEWESIGYDWKRPPDGVRPLAPEIQPEPEDIEAELQEQEEIAYIAKRKRRLALFKQANDAVRKRLGEREFVARYGTGW